MKKYWFLLLIPVFGFLILLLRYHLPEWFKKKTETTRETTFYREFSATFDMACGGQKLQLDFNQGDTLLVRIETCVTIDLDGTGVEFLTPQSPTSDVESVLVRRIAGRGVKKIFWINVQLAVGVPACRCN